MAFSFLTPSGAALSQPDGITSDAQGNLFIASRANAEVVEYHIATNTSTDVGSINGLDDLAPAAGLGSSSAPEPSSLLMFGAGALGLWGVRRRRDGADRRPA